MNHGPLYDLPRDVLRRIWLLYLPPAAEIALISSCKLFYREHSLEVLYTRLRDLSKQEHPVLLAIFPWKTRVRRVVKYKEFKEENL